MNALNSSSFVPPDFSNLNTTSTSAAVNVPGQSSSQDATQKGQPATGSSGIPAYASGQPATGSSGIPVSPSLQGSQGQTSQSINSMGQTLGSIQGSIADSSSAENNDSDASGIKNEENSLLSDIAGLSADKQIPSKKKEKKDSGEGSGNQEKGQVYVMSAAASLQEGEGTQSVNAITSNQTVSNFTLKVDASESMTTETTTQSSTVDENGAPKLPPGPNVFEMIADGTSLSSQLQLYSVDSMVAANKGMSSNQATAYAKQITDIQNYVNSKNSAQNKSHIATAFSWIVNIAMIVGGAITLDPMLVGAGIAGVIMTADPKLAAGLTSALEKMGIPKEVAGIMATVIIIGATCIATAGVGAGLEVAADTATVAAKAAISASEDAAEAGTEDLTASVAKAATKDTPEAFAKGQTWSESFSDMTRFKNAMNTPEGRAAFQTSIKSQIEGGAKSVWDGISNMTVSKMIDTALQAITSAAKSLEDSAKSAGKSLSDAASSSFRAITNPLETMDESLVALYKLAARFSTSGSEAGAEATSMTDQAMASIKSLGNNLASMDPLKVIQITAELTMAALTLTGQVMTYKATALQAIALKNQGYLLESQALTTNITQQITLANSQINEVLSDMNSSITSAGTVLSQMSQLSAETTGQLHGSSA